MKQVTIFLLAAFLLISCSSGKRTHQVKKQPGHHILSTDKRAVKDHLKHRKTHAEAARKKREEFDLYHYSSHTHHKTKKTRKDSH